MRVENLPIGFMIAVALAGAGSLAVLLAAAYGRSRMMPVCCKCGAWKVCRSRTLYARDTLALFAMLVPLRCMGCLSRFYGMRGVAPRADRPQWQREHRDLRYVDHHTPLEAMLYSLFADQSKPGRKERVQWPSFGASSSRQSEPEYSPALEHDEELSRLLSVLVSTHHVSTHSAPAQQEPATRVETVKTVSFEQQQVEQKSVRRRGRKRRGTGFTKAARIA